MLSGHYTSIVSSEDNTCRLYDDNEVTVLDDISAYKYKTLGYFFFGNCDSVRFLQVLLFPQNKTQPTHTIHLFFPFI